MTEPRLSLWLCRALYDLTNRHHSAFTLEDEFPETSATSSTTTIDTMLTIPLSETPGPFLEKTLNVSRITAMLAV